MRNALQPYVANRLLLFVAMRDWGKFWEQTCAPKLKARKKSLGREMPERAIAEAVQRATNKKSKRQLVSLWLLGKREPYVSQFFALCHKLGLDPSDVLELQDAERDEVPLASVDESSVAVQSTGRRAKKSKR